MAKKDKVILSQEIIKLTEKMKSNPGSKFFLPLAEEYVNSGMFDDAASILKDGLKTHPTYFSAMVLLGKVYLQKGMINEAKIEFEKVIERNPDNILASKKLARIYKEENERDKAVNVCKSILAISPNDEEIKNILNDIDGLDSLQKSDERTRLQTNTKDNENTPLQPGLFSDAPMSGIDQVDQIMFTTDNNEYQVDELTFENPIIDDELATDAIANLYLKQGHYEEAIQIYEKMLKKDPYNNEINQKIEDALSLMSKAKVEESSKKLSMEEKIIEIKEDLEISHNETVPLQSHLTKEKFSGEIISNDFNEYYDKKKEFSDKILKDDKIEKHYLNMGNLDKIKMLETWLDKIKGRRIDGFSR